MSPTSNKIGSNAFSTIASSSIGIVTSVLLDAIIIGLFGMGWQTDAYFIAITIPTLLATIIALLATRVVQPLFIRKRESNGESEAWSLLNLIMTSGTLVVTVVAVGGAILSSVLVRPQTIGFEPSLVAFVTKLSVLMFLMLPLFLPIMVMRAILNSLGMFALPGAMKFIENIFKIIFVVLAGRSIGVMALVLGTFAGAVCQVLSFYVAMRRKGYRFKPVFRLNDPDLLRSYGLMVFPLAGQICALGVEFFNNAIGSTLGVGNVSALRLATRIIECFGGLLAGSIVLAAMPTIASSVSRGDHDGAKDNLRRALYLLLLVTMPLSVWLALMHRPFIALLYERMSFTSADTILVSNVLLMMVPYIFLCRLFGLFELPFFAHHDTRTPLFGSIAQAVLYVIISLLLLGAFGLYSLALARSLSFFIASLFLLQLLRHRSGKLGLSELRKPLSKLLFASLVMGLFILAGTWLPPMIPVTGFTAKAIALGLPSLAGSIGLLIALVLFGVLDLSVIKRAIIPLAAYYSRVMAYKR